MIFDFAHLPLATVNVLIQTKEPPLANRKNPGIWNKTPYAWIHFDNIGSWKTGDGFFKSKRKFADYMVATFILPIFVIGEWEMRMPPDLVHWQPLPSSVIKSPGLIERFIPDLHLGIFGRLLSGGMGASLILFVLSIFFPPVLQIVNAILGAMPGLSGASLTGKSYDKTVSIDYPMPFGSP